MIVKYKNTNVTLKYIMLKRNDTTKNGTARTWSTAPVSPLTLKTELGLSKYTFSALLIVFMMLKFLASPMSDFMMMFETSIIAPHTTIEKLTIKAVTTIHKIIFLAFSFHKFKIIMTAAATNSKTISMLA